MAQHRRLPTNDELSIYWVRDAVELERALERVPRKEPLAIDCESNGMYVYEAELCVLQLAYQRAGRVEVMLVDGLSTELEALAPWLDHRGPPKLLHDLTFDAQLLASRGLRLERVLDTSVAAKLLGRPKLGLASLLEEEFGLEVDKELQHFDWGTRPLPARTSAYLASDVAHLLPLWNELATQANEADIAREVAVAIEYKLTTAQAPPPQDAKPRWAKLKGLGTLETHQKPVAKSLFEVREQVAKERNVPAHKVLPNAALLQLAKVAPRSEAALSSHRSARRLGSASGRFLRAIAEGRSKGRLSSSEAEWLKAKGLGGAEIQRRRGLDKRLRNFRQAEAERRGVDPQVVLPSYCIAALLSEEFAEHGQLGSLPGFGTCRVERYGQRLERLLAEPQEPRWAERRR